MKKILNNKTYIKTASSSVPLFYHRSKMVAGQQIDGFRSNKNLIRGLKNCDRVLFSMYWKPLGDSFLFLSVVQACVEYLRLVRGNNMPELLVDDKFSVLVKHAQVLRSAKVIKNGVSWFKDEAGKGSKTVLITDDDPIDKSEGYSMFNSEDYQYPMFYEALKGRKKLSYYSRPARYFLTFEREVGVRLFSDPNQSLPDFIMPKSKRLQKLCIEKFGFDPDNNNEWLFGIVSVASMVQKKFGLLRFTRLAMKYLEVKSNNVAIILANSKEESPGEWLKFEKMVGGSKARIKVINSDDFELLAYIFARCKFVLGNDTGFSHLAAMSRISPSRDLVTTFIIYSRHDYRKWSTGKVNVHPITTELSRYLSNNNMSISRDKIGTTKWGIKEWAYSITPNQIYKKILKNE